MNWKELYQKIKEHQSPIKHVIGVLLILIGIGALLTPFTPGSWLVFVGLEILGIRLAIWDRIKSKLF